MGDEKPSDFRQDALAWEQDLKGLMLHPGWKVLERFVDQQSTLRITEIVLRPLDDDKTDTRDGLTRALSQEFAKGEVSGLKLALSWPASIISQAQETRQMKRAKGEDDDE